MSSFLIPVLIAVLLVVLILILKKFSTRKAPPAETREEDVSVFLREEAVEAEKEDVAAPLEEVVDEVTEVHVETEIIVEPETVSEPEVAEQAEPVLQPEVVEEPEAVPEPIAEAKPEITPEEPFPEVEESTVEKGAEGLVAPALEAVACVSIESYEQRLLALKDKQQAALTSAMENNEEKRREQLQVEFVAVTEALDFLEQSHGEEVSCRNDALAVLTKMQPELDAEEYERAWESVRSGDTLDAEQVFDTFADRDSPLSALAAYQSGRLAECRIDLNGAMERFEKAVSLDGTNPDYLCSAALLARKLYLQKKALSWFTSLEKALEERGDDSVELALARRELAYSSALVGQHKQAGELYKKAMVSISNLLGSTDPEMGICWYQIGKLQEALGKFEKAEEPYKKALAIMDKAGRSVVLGDILDKLSALYMELDMEKEAVLMCERLCSFKEESPNPYNATLVMAYTNLAEAYKISGKYEEAEQKYIRSLELTEELRGKDHAAVGSVLQELVKVCQRLRKTEEAKAYQDRATAIFQRVVEEQEAAGQKGVNLTLSD